MVKIAGVTIQTSRREKNEDNFCIGGEYLNLNHADSPIIEDESQVIALAVFDGIGGLSKGDTASYIAAKIFSETISRDLENVIKKPDLYTEIMNKISHQITAEIGKNSGTTMAAVIFGSKKVMVTNLGDSRVYKLHKEKLQQITVDHVLPMPGYQKAPLVQYLGYSDDVEMQPDIVLENYHRGDKYLICTDGVTDIMTREDLEGLLATDQDVRDIVTDIIKKIEYYGPVDNSTVIVAEVK